MQVLAALHEAGCETVVMTDGPRGAEAFDGSTHYTVPAIDVEVASTLGAGDAFASGCAAALAQGHGLREALRAGALNAANVCRYLGGKRGLLRADEMRQALTERRREQVNSDRPHA